MKNVFRGHIFKVLQLQHWKNYSHGNIKLLTTSISNYSKIYKVLHQVINLVISQKSEFTKQPTSKLILDIYTVKKALDNMYKISKKKMTTEKLSVTYSKITKHFTVPILKNNILLLYPTLKNYLIYLISYENDPYLSCIPKCRFTFVPS